MLYGRYSTTNATTYRQLYRYKVGAPAPPAPSSDFGYGGWQMTPLAITTG